MSKSAFTVKVFGYYLIALGMALIVAPNLLLTTFRLPATPEVWIRVVGVVVFELGVCYVYAAKCEATALFQATVYARAFVFAAFVAFAVLGLVSPLLILFGAADLASSVWTQVALSRELRVKPHV
ncbi:MAG: hypothetical protein ABIT82_12315 [Ramlibacter sp.]